MRTISIQHRKPDRVHFDLRCCVRRAQGIERNVGERHFHVDAARPPDFRAACHSPLGRSRAFWPGFALFGSVYLGLALIPPIGEQAQSLAKGLATCIPSFQVRLCRTSSYHSLLPARAVATSRVRR